MPLRASFLATVLAAFVSQQAPRADAPEYNVKAGYLLLFTRYVDWPASSFSSPETPLELCLLGKDPFGPVLDQTVSGLRSQGRLLQVRRLGSADAARSCHVVFIGGARSAEQEAAWVAALRDLPILTVTDGATSVAAGAIVAFVRDASKVRFEIDLGAMERARLKIRSPMLVSARSVRPGNARGKRD